MLTNQICIYKFSFSIINKNTLSFRLNSIKLWHFQLNNYGYYIYKARQNNRDTPTM